MTTVRYPEMRREIVSALDAFADPAYQRRVWIDKQMPNPQYYDDLDTNIHILYDDTSVLPDPSVAVGAFLVDDAEAAALARLNSVLEPLVDELGNAPDSTYLADPRWSEVVAAARAAAQVLASHDTAG